MDALWELHNSVLEIEVSFRFICLFLLTHYGSAHYTCTQFTLNNNSWPNKEETHRTGSNVKRYTTPLTSSHTKPCISQRLTGKFPPLATIRLPSCRKTLSDIVEPVVSNLVGSYITFYLNCRADQWENIRRSLHQANRWSQLRTKHPRRNPLLGRRL